MALDLSKMCRCCLGLDAVLLSIFENKSLPGGQFTLADMLKGISTLMPIENDGMPSKVCLQCLSEINRAYSFKLKCENSESTLKQLLPSPDPEVTAEKTTNHEDLVADIEEIIVPNAEEESELEIEQEDFPKTEHVEEFEFLSEGEQEVIEHEEGEDEENTDSGEYYIVEDSLNSDDGLLVVPRSGDNTSKEQKKSVSLLNGKPALNCPYCQMQFVIQRNLDKHIEAHLEKHIESMDQILEEDERILPNEEEEEPASKRQKRTSPLIEVDNEPVTEVNTDSNEIDFKYSCPKCGSGFANERNLKFHVHTDKCTQPKFECSKCNKVFIDKTKLAAHMALHASFQCTRCSLQFSKKSDLAEHAQKCHKGLIKNQCSICNKVFTMLSTLKDHLRIHSGERPFLCTICGKGFNQNANLKQHMMRHSQQKPHQCNECSDTFVSKGELKSHMRKHTGEHPFVCNICESGFTTSSSLNKHKRIHTGERPYACDLCPMRFVALNTLKNHRRTHTGEKPFKCKFCDRGFTQKTDCNAHMRIHTGEKPFVCNICGQSFPVSSSLKNHMRMHSRKEDKERITVDDADGNSVHIEVETEEGT